MPIFKKESLETLRQRVDLVDLLGSHIDLKPAGASYKALCPFHDEKTPSFVVQRGDGHYHCFGCGAHGDAIAFLMDYQKMSFSDAVESLAERYRVHLEKVESKNDDGIQRKLLRDALESACDFYHFCLLHTGEGQEALRYLYSRGLDLEFISKFRIGLAPKQHGIFQGWMKEKKVGTDVLISAGLLKKGDDGRTRDFFYDRITFPIHHSTGAVIGFSSRKYKEETFGGKYVNTPETPLFKKSRVLFGLNYCRRKIAKTRQAIVVEGQMDALRLIHAGFDWAVAGQGTAFGEGHVAELIQLGVTNVYLALDGDSAGREAAIKIGNLFQKVGVEAMIVPIPPGQDPDTIITKEGPDSFREYINQSRDYLTFLVEENASQLSSPAAKTKLVYSLASQIRSWDNEVMVHESLRKLAQLTRVPEEMVGVGQTHVPNLYIRKNESAGLYEVDPDRILESDLLRWLLTPSEQYRDFVRVAQLNLKPFHFRDPCSKQVYQAIISHDEPVDLIELIIDLEDGDVQEYLARLMEKRVDKDRAETHFKETVQRILDRNWMEQREALRKRIAGGLSADEDAMQQLKEFEALKKSRPVMKE